MIRVMGAVLVAAGAAWIGFQAAAGLRRRVRALEEMAAGLALLERDLELTGPPLPQLLARGGARGQGPARALFLGCAQGMDNLAREDFSARGRPCPPPGDAWRSCPLAWGRTAAVSAESIRPWACPAGRSW